MRPSEPVHSHQEAFDCYHFLSGPTGVVYLAGQSDVFNT